MADESVVQRLELILKHAGLLTDALPNPRQMPVAEWLDSLGRLQLVAAIEKGYDIDLEEELMGPSSRGLTLSKLAELVHARIGRTI